MLRTVVGIASLVALSGCCNTRCAPHAVYIVVSADGASVSGVEIEGGDFLCNEQDGSTVCTPNGAIETGEHELVVSAPGYDSAHVALSVRMHEPPAFSCDCRLPIGEAIVELGDGAPEPDAGPSPGDGGEPPDAGTGDGG